MSADGTAHAAGTGAAGGTGPLAWPGDPEGVTAADIDFEALAHVLANTCRFGGRVRRYHSLAGHAVIVSEEVAALDGLAEEDRRVLALHALIAGAASAWLGGEGPASQRAAERTAKLAAGIERAVREAAGLDPALAGEHAELLRFIARMTLAAERRDLFDGEPGSRGAGPVLRAGGQGSPLAGAAFPPLKRRIRPVGPGRAAKLWLARLEALRGPSGGAGEAAGDTTGDTTGDTEHETPGNGEDGDVAHIPAKEGVEQRAPRRRGKDDRQAA